MQEGWIGFSATAAASRSRAWPRDMAACTVLAGPGQKHPRGSIQGNTAWHFKWLMAVAVPFTCISDLLPWKVAFSLCYCLPFLLVRWLCEYWLSVLYLHLSLWSGSGSPGILLFADSRPHCAHPSCDPHDTIRHIISYWWALGTSCIPKASYGVLGGIFSFLPKELLTHI